MPIAEGWSRGFSRSGWNARGGDRLKPRLQLRSTIVTDCHAADTVDGKRVRYAAGAVSRVHPQFSPRVRSFHGQVVCLDSLGEADRIRTEQVFRDVRSMKKCG